MDLEIILIEVSQKNKYDITYMLNLKHYKNEFNWLPAKKSGNKG